MWYIKYNIIDLSTDGLPWNDYLGKVQNNLEFVAKSVEFTLYDRGGMIMLSEESR